MPVFIGADVTPSRKERAQQGTQGTQGGRPPRRQQWLTVMEVCREYNLSRQTIYDLCQKSKLPYYTVASGRRRFRRDEIEPVLAPYRHPIKARDSKVPDPLDGLAGPVDAIPDRS